MPGNVLFIVPYPVKRAPSQRFRVELYERFLKEAGISYKIASFIDDATWDILYKNGNAAGKLIGILKGYLKRLKTVLLDAPGYDYIFIHREAAPLGPPIFEWIIAKILHKKIIYDFDDAIWIPNTSAANKLAGWLKAFWKVKYICRWSYKVVGGNDFLCSYARKYNPDTVLIPTCVDVELKHNRIKEHVQHKPVVGWTGSHSTLFYLNDIIPVIRQLQNELDFSFMVIADYKPELDLKDWQFTRWSEAAEISDLLKLDVGIMPLKPDAWSEGKCGFKLIQYLSCGVPAVADPIGVNSDIIEDGVSGFICADHATWKEKLKLLITDAALRQRLGKSGRERIEKCYSIQSQKEKFLSLFRNQQLPF